MGRPIVYCAGCGKKLGEPDFSAGRGLEAGRQFCIQCKPPATSYGLGSSTSPAPSPSARPIARPRPAARRSLAVPIVAAGVASMVTLVAILALSGGTGARIPESPPGETPVTDLAAAAIKAAREFSRMNPSNLAGQATLWEQAVRACGNTPHRPEAEAELARVRAGLKEAQARDLDQLAAQVRPLLEAEQYKAALAVLEGARKRFEGPEAAAALAGRVKEVGDAAAERARQLREQAGAARRRGNEEEVKTLRARLEKWGFPEHVALFDRTVEQAGPPGILEIFNGKDLTGWTATTGRWTVEEGTLVGINPNPPDAFIRTDRILRDYALTAKLKSEQRTYIEIHVNNGSSVGSLTLDPGGWHELKVVSRGDEVEVSLNGAKAKVLRKANKAEGFLGFYVIPRHVLRIKDLLYRKL